MKFRLEIIVALMATLFLGLMVMATLMWQDINEDADKLRVDVSIALQNQSQLAVGLVGVTARQAMAQATSNQFVETYNVNRSEILNDLTSLQFKQIALEKREVPAVKSLAALNTMCPDKATMEDVAAYAEVTSIFWSGVLGVKREQLGLDKFVGFMEQALQIDPELWVLFRDGWTREIDPAVFVIRLETKFAAAVANAFEPCQLD